MSFLVRTGSGPFLLPDTFTLEEIAELIDAGKDSFMTPMGMLVSQLPLVELKPEGIQHIISGRAINQRNFTVREELSLQSTVVRLEHEGRLVGIGNLVLENDSTCLVKPKKVLI